MILCDICGKPPGFQMKIDEFGVLRPTLRRQKLNKVNGKMICRECWIDDTPAKVEDIPYMRSSLGKAQEDNNVDVHGFNSDEKERWHKNGSRIGMRFLQWRRFVISPKAPKLNFERGGK